VLHNRKINTSPVSLDDRETLKKMLTDPPVKKIDLHFPLGLEVTARNLKGVTIKDALDAIYKQYRKKASLPNELQYILSSGRLLYQLIEANHKFGHMLRTNVNVVVNRRLTMNSKTPFLPASNGTRKSHGLGWSYTARRRVHHNRRRSPRRAKQKRKSNLSSLSILYTEEIHIREYIVLEI
jgi:hypothetical protein